MGRGKIYLGVLLAVLGVSLLAAQFVHWGFSPLKLGQAVEFRLQAGESLSSLTTRLYEKKLID